jgi:hypothetical protein
MSTAPVRRIPANDVSHAIITAAMKVHTDSVPDCWKVLTQLVGNINP